MSIDVTKLDESLEHEIVVRLLESQTAVTPPPGLRAKVLDRVHSAVLRESNTFRVNEGPWKPLGPGIESKLLYVDTRAGTKSFLLRGLPGASLPAHSHHCDEECLVLEGEFTMGELTLTAGDFHYAATGSNHPVATTRSGVLVYIRGGADDYPMV